jgi:iron complex transport system substrate-binding protein
VDESEYRQIRDEANREVRVYGKIERVISLAPNLTEIIYAIGAGDRLVGNTTYCDYPEQAKSVQKVGDTLQPNIERILALRPNLIFISTSSQLEAFARQLSDHGIPVYVSDPHDLEGVIHSIENIAKLLNREQQAGELVSKLRERMTTVEAAVKNRKPVTVFYQLSAEPLYTAGRQAFVTDLIKRAGGQSVTADVAEAWPRYSEESAVAAKPEAIILPTGGSMGGANADVAEGLRKSPAVLEGRVIKIDGDLLVRPGPRAIDGLEQLAHALHPEDFK